MSIISLPISKSKLDDLISKDIIDIEFPLTKFWLKRLYYSENNEGIKSWEWHDIIDSLNNPTSSMCDINDVVYYYGLTPKDFEIIRFYNTRDVIEIELEYREIYFKVRSDKITIVLKAKRKGS